MHPIQSNFGELRLTTKEETRVALTCPSCGNDQNFLVKTLQMHVVHLEDSRVEVSEEGRPAVLEVLCDECETALNFDEVDEASPQGTAADARRPLRCAPTTRLQCPRLPRPRSNRIPGTPIHGISWSSSVVCLARDR